MRLGFVGGGKMAEAIIRGVVSSGSVAPGDVRVSDISHERCSWLRDQYGVGMASANTEVVATSDVVVLAVKPQGLADVLEEIAPWVTTAHLVVSIAAGKRLAGIAKALPSARLVRVMPNLPATVGEGVSAFCMGDTAGEADRQVVSGLLGSFGQAVELPEEQFDAVTAVSGSGPAFFAYFLAQVIEAGIEQGLAAEHARRLATRTMLGTARLLAEQTITPLELVQAVCSKRGTTEAGMQRLAVPQLSELVKATLAAAANRSRELSA